MRPLLTAALLFLSALSAFAQEVPQQRMQEIYDASVTPYKYGMVVAPESNFRKYDCPTVFRQDGSWYMTFVCYDGKDGTDGRGYETWLAQSDDLLHWEVKGKILSLPPTTPASHLQSQTSNLKSQSSNLKPQSSNPKPQSSILKSQISNLKSQISNLKSQSFPWDQNQRGGFPALIDYEWEGSHEMQTFKGKHWMTYIGGPGTGYEAVNAPLSIGIASTAGDITQPHPWATPTSPLMSYEDPDAHQRGIFQVIIKVWAVGIHLVLVYTW